MEDKMIKLTLAQLLEYATKIGVKPEEMIVRSFEIDKGGCVVFRNEAMIATSWKSRNGVEIVTADQIFDVVYGS